MATNAAAYQQAVHMVNGVLNTSAYTPSAFPMIGTSMFLNVTVTVFIYKLLSLTNDATLTVAMEVDLSWNDPNVPGNWAAYTSSLPLYINATSVWTMNLYLQDPATANIYLQPVSLAYLSQPPVNASGATVQEHIINQFSVVCDSMNLVSFPFDSQTCIMQLAYKDGYPVNMLLPGNLSVSNNVGNGEWLMNNVTWANASSLISTEGAQSGFALQFSFTRNSYYYVIFLILPTILLEAVGMLTFILPTDHGEKVVLGATLILGVNVLLTSLNTLIPQMQPNEVPNIVTALKVGLIMTAVSLFEGVIIQTLRIVATDLPDSVAHFIDKSIFKACRCPEEEDESESESGTSRAVTDSSANLRSVTSTTSVLDASEETLANGSAENAATSEANEHSVRTLQNINALLKSIEAYFVELLESRKKKEKKEELVERAWRKVEYVCNFVTLVIYSIIVGYYIGVYIYS